MKKKLFNKPSSSGLSVLKTTKIVIREFWYDYEKPNMEKKQNYVTWIETALWSP